LTKKLERVIKYEERAYTFAKRVVLFIKKHDFTRIDFPLLHQLLRSATSIGANIIEGQHGNSKKNLVSYFSIALRSATETSYWLRLIGDTCKVDSAELVSLMKECVELRKIIAKSIIVMKRNLS
jgi:four helix bundle protein